MTVTHCIGCAGFSQGQWCFNETSEPFADLRVKAPLGGGRLERRAPIAIAARFGRQLAAVQECGQILQENAPRNPIDCQVVNRDQQAVTAGTVAATRLKIDKTHKVAGQRIEAGLGLAADCFKHSALFLRI